MISRAKALGLIGGAGALLSPIRFAWAQTNTPIRISAIYFEGGAEPFYAKEHGFFASQGLSAAFLTADRATGSSAPSLNFLAQGVADIAFADVTVIAAQTVAGADIVVIAPGHEQIESAPTAALAVAHDSTIRSAKDLVGKTVAISNPQSFNGYGPRQWLETSGVDPSIVHFIQVGFDAMVPRLDAGTVDAAMFVEPYLSQAIASGHPFLAAPGAAIAPVFLQGVFVASSLWARANRDIVRRFVAALRATATWANDSRNKAITADILMQYTHVPQSVTESSTRTHFAEVLTPALLQPGIDISAKYGGFPALRAEKIIYNASG